MSDEPLVSPEEVASVLSKGGAEEQTAPQEETSNVYSLRRPVAIAREAEPEARQRVADLAGKLAEIVGRELEIELKIELQGFQQQQVIDAVDSVTKPSWVVSMILEAGGGVALVFDPGAALTLVEVALGGTGNTQAGSRGPTPLESRVMGNLGDVIARALKQKTGVEFNSAEFGVGSVCDKLAARGETVGAAPLKLQFGDAECSALLLATTGLLVPSARRQERQEQHQIGPLAARVERVPVTFRPVLEAGGVTLQDLTRLEEGTVLRFDVPEDSLLELRAEGLALFGGRIRRTEGGAEFVVSWRKGGGGATESGKTDDEEEAQ